MNYKSFRILPALLIMMFVACNSSSESKKEDDKLKTEQSLSEVDLTQGKLIYDRNCKVCHQANGQGIPNFYPPIVNTKHSKGDKDYLVKVLLYGLSGKVEIEGKTYNGVMANYRNFSDEDIAAVLNYVRSMSDKNLEPVMPEDVAKFR